MMLRLSWATPLNVSPSGGSAIVEDWESIKLRLDYMKKSLGTVTLTVIGGARLGPMSLQVIADSGVYVVALLESDENDTNVRAYTHPTAGGERVCVLGDYWDARDLISDFDLVLMMFKEFFQTGDVSRQLLN